MDDSRVLSPESPPRANRGVEMSGGPDQAQAGKEAAEQVRVGLGWIDGSSRCAVEELAAILDCVFGPSQAGHPVAYYQNSRSYSLGRVHLMSSGKSRALGTARVEVEQTALDELGWEQSLALLADLLAAGFRPSRLDLWLDDHAARISPGGVREAYRSGCAITHARPGRFVDNDLDGSSTYYLGAPSSDRRMRVYDKRGPVRFELQGRRIFAQHCAEIVSSSDDPVRALLSCLVAYVDFRQDKGRSDGARSPRLAWWEELVGDASPAAPAPAVPALGLDAFAQYVLVHWSKGLAELDERVGPEYMMALMAEGRRRLRVSRGLQHDPGYEPDGWDAEAIAAMLESRDSQDVGHA